MSTKELDPYTAKAERTDLSPQQKVEGLHNIVNTVKTGMLTTRSAAGDFHSRAMAPVKRTFEPAFPSPRSDVDLIHYCIGSGPQPGHACVYRELRVAQVRRDAERRARQRLVLRPFHHQLGIVRRQGSDLPRQGEDREALEPHVRPILTHTLVASVPNQTSLWQDGRVVRRPWGRRAQRRPERPSGSCCRSYPGRDPILGRDPRKCWPRSGSCSRCHEWQNCGAGRVEDDQQGRGAYMRRPPFALVLTPR